MLESPCRSGPSFPSPAQLFGQVVHAVPSLFPYGTSSIAFASPNLFEFLTPKVPLQRCREAVVPGAVLAHTVSPGCSGRCSYS